MTWSGDLSRRKLLSMAAAAGGVVAVGSMLPPSVQRAMAAPMPEGGLDAIEHVIVLTQENRSFDHYFGKLQGVRGYGDRTPLGLQSGASVFHQPIPGGGEVLPFSVREAAEAAGRPDSDIQYLGGLPHGFTDATSAWANGWNNNWIAAKTAATMTYYERSDIPLQYELADTFTICDAYHCSVNGSTNPNRNYLWSGTVGYEPDSTARAVTNAAYAYAHKGYDWTTYPERLEAAGVSWQIYQEWDNFTDNAVEYFKPFKMIGTKMLAAVQGGYLTTEHVYDTLASGSLSPTEQQRLIRELAAGRERLTNAEQALFDKAMYRSEPGTLVSRLRADITAGTLPKVSWLVPSAADSEHPGVSTPVGSANLVWEVLDAIASDPETWSKTVLFINFDENDGYFDHVPPPVEPRPASGNSDDWFNGQPIGLGPRVPMTIVSPWTIGGRVSSEVFDHTSVLQFLERWTGVSEPNISAWRRKACGDLTSAFDFLHEGAPPSVDQPGRVPAPVDRWRPTPPADQQLPQQESGRRAALPMPNEPHVSAVVDGSGKLALRLRNTGKSSAHFSIYPYAGELALPAHVDVDVDAVASETLTLAGDAFSVVVQGPNRFWHALSGSTSGAAARLEVGTLPSLSGGLVQVRLLNGGKVAVTVTLSALAYAGSPGTLTLAPGRQRTVQWGCDRGWYDLKVTVAEDSTFRRRLTGHSRDGHSRDTVTGLTA